MSGGEYGTSEMVDGNICAPGMTPISEWTELAVAKIEDLRHSTGPISVGKSKYGGTTQTRQTGSDATGRVHKMNVALAWAGHNDLAIGKLTIVQDRKKGDLKVELPGGDDTCSGTFEIINGTYKSGGMVHGAWSLACTNNRAAAGKFVSRKPFKGEGTGTDDKGNTIKFTYSR